MCDQPLSGVDLEQIMPHHYYVQLSNQSGKKRKALLCGLSIHILGNDADSHVYMHVVHEDRQVDIHMFTHGNTT